MGQLPGGLEDPKKATLVTTLWQSSRLLVCG